MSTRTTASATPVPRAARQPITGEPRIIGPGFQEKVWRMVERVPHGAVTTYGDVGGALGSRRIARQVGFALAALDGARAAEVPWHRVINSTGRISYRSDTARGAEQQTRLSHEGIRFDDDGRVIDFATKRHAFPPARSAKTRSTPARPAKPAAKARPGKTRAAKAGR